MVTGFTKDGPISTISQPERPAGEVMFVDSHTGASIIIRPVTPNGAHCGFPMQTHEACMTWPGHGQMIVPVEFAELFRDMLPRALDAFAPLMLPKNPPDGADPVLSLASGT